MLSEKINNLKNELKNDPVFQMSLHSKELFHSNFWAWLFERNIEYAKIFFPDLKAIEKDGVKREEKNRDITIWSAGKAYVIENKFKSIPSLKQILEYEEKVGKEIFAKGVITGIVDPGFGNQAGNWEFKSYKTISHEIERIATKYEKDDSEEAVFEKQIIIHYAKLLEKLSCAILEGVEAVGGKWVTRFRCDDLSKIRMDDIAKKLIASSFARYLCNKIKSEGVEEKIDGYTLTVNSFYTRDQAAVEAFYYQDDEKKMENRKISAIGIQIQGAEYRWCIITNGVTDVELFRKIGWIREFDKSENNNKSKTIRKRKTKMRANICRFGESFVYQYYVLDEKNSYDELWTQIYEDIKFAGDLIKSMKINDVYSE